MRCMKSLLAHPPGRVARQSGRQVTLVLGTPFPHINGATFYLSFRSSDGKLLRLVQFTRLTLNTLTLDS